MKRALLLMLFAWPAAFTQAASTNADADAIFLSARDAYRANEQVKLARLEKAFSGQILSPWVSYWLLKERLEEGNDDGIPSFLTRHEGQYLAEKLRTDWLRHLAKHQNWPVFQEELPKLQTPLERDLICHVLQERMARETTFPLTEARELWLAGEELPEACMPLMKRLIDEQHLSQEDFWMRLRRLFLSGNIKAVKTALPVSGTAVSKTIDTVHASPTKHLAKLPRNFDDSRFEREMALFAIMRLAKSDPAEAATHWQSLETNFSETDRAWGWGILAWQAARSHLPQALTWYAAAHDTPLSSDQMAWHARAALRAGNWLVVEHAIARMPKALASQSVWIFWKARALENRGQLAEAQGLYRKIADQSNFYGNLSAEHLGQMIDIPPACRPPSTLEMAQIATHPGIARSLALIRLDMRAEGLREWAWSLRNMNDRQLLATAQLAQRHDIIDRAIHTADKTLVEHDFQLRYPMPFRDQVESYAQRLLLDPSWVYGLIRQESRFISHARSSVGAQGLMQIMPKTAKWMAKKTGVSGFRLASLGNTDTNVKLGTSYLKTVLDALDHHPVLATAAYNAGPGRARKWRAAWPLEGAIYAETIPFEETRDYVKKVMSNAVYYAALSEGKPQSLKARLGIIRPQGMGDETAEYLP